MNLSGKIAVITGANKGMGKAMSERLSEMGSIVYMVCRDERRGKNTVNQLKQKNTNLKLLLKIADMGKIADIEKIAEEISEEREHIDYLINNAAVNLERPNTRIENLSIEVFEETMNVNVRGPLLLCQKLIPLLKKSEDARIINFSSGLGQLTVPRMGYYPAYSISKTTINAITKNLANELKNTSIMVFSVDPGWIRTDLGGPGAMLEIDEGIETPIFLVTEFKEKLKNGEFYKEKKILGW